MNLSNLNLPPKGVVAIVGTQWGDEGKGKIVDLLADTWADVIARGTGGANAGHTICVNDKSHVFHLMPSGILSGKPCYLGSGVAFDPEVMRFEMDELGGLGKSYDYLRISRDAHLVTPIHTILDRVHESKAKSGKIGTTGRGIGPTFTAHYAREGLRVVDLLNPDKLWEKLNKYLHAHTAELSATRIAVKDVMQADEFLTQFADEKNIIDLERMHQAYVEFGERLRPFIADTDSLVRQAVEDGLCVLLEGAQATLLSIDYGMYPMVTSSDSTVAGLAKGVGLRESQVDLCIGIVKAPYTSKVGGGSFPTRLGSAADDEIYSGTTPNINSTDPGKQGAALRRAGKEYGATTGRPRDCGWLDLPLLRYALQFGGDVMAMTKADVLDGCAVIRICTHYIYRGLDYDFGDSVLKSGDQVDVAFGDDDLLGHMEPQYQEFPGWQGDITTIRSYDDLPPELLDIIEYIEADVGSKFAIVSVGPDRQETIIR